MTLVGKRRRRDAEVGTTAVDQRAELEALRMQVADLQDALRLQSERVDQIGRLADRAIECHEDGFTMLEAIADRLEASGFGASADAPYRKLVVDVRAEIRRHVPRGSVVLVVSKGDPALIRLPGRVGWHFPRAADGAYPGFHPHSSTTAIAALEALRAKGGDYLVLPRSAFWWIDHYDDLFLHIEQHYDLLADLDACRIYSLRTCPDAGDLSVRAHVARICADAVARHDRPPTMLDWTVAGFAPPSLTGGTVAADPSMPLPFIDRSFDLVVTDSGDRAALSDAHRVAAMGVVSISEDPDSGRRCDVKWREDRSHHSRSVSVIVTAEGGPPGEACLESLATTLPDCLDIDVVVVPRGVDADRLRVSRRWRHPRHRLQLVADPRVATVTAARTHGAALANGEILVFVDGDTLLLPGWLPPLLRVLHNVGRAGAVAPLEVAPDGRLLSAGGIVFRDGTVLPFGRDDHKAGGAALAHLRPVEVVSAGVLATPRRLFDEQAGCPVAYVESAYADADYCFALRSAGHHVYCQPESVAVRQRDPSTATPDAVGAADHEAFVERWRDVLRRGPVRSSGAVVGPLMHALHVPTDLMAGGAA